MRSLLSRLLILGTLFATLASPIEAQSFRPGRPAARAGLVSLVAPSSALTTTYRSSASMNGGYASSVSFTGVNYYAGKNVIAIVSSQTNQASVTLGGTAGTKVAEITTGFENISFWEVPKASGGSGNIDIVTGGLSTFNAVGYILWSTNASATFVASSGLAYGYNPDPSETAASITKPTGGSILWAGQSESGGATITGTSGTTVDTSMNEPVANWRIFGGQRTSTGKPGTTGTDYGGSQLLGVSYQ